MPIDVHAHYVPRAILERLQENGAEYGIAVLGSSPACNQCLQFGYGLKVRPFFARLVEDVAARIEHMDRQKIRKQVLSIWADIFGYALPAPQGRAWHRLLNQCLGDWCAKDPAHFAWLASGYMPNAADAARELERAVSEGAVGGVVAANLEGANLGDLPLDEYWAAASQLGVPVFIHPVQPEPAARTKRFVHMNPIVQYTFDTTLTLGSLIFAGVFDRFPTLQLIVSHGGGALPYLIGRFDCLHTRVDRKVTNDSAQRPPSEYLRRMSYDTIVHNPKALRFLADSVGIDRLVIGTDDSFPPADHDPLGSLRAAGFKESEIEIIGEANPARLFRF
jgi:aminocarboxymuconate-semialdehyde decarboxylase